MIRYYFVCFFFQAEDGIRDLVRSRGLGDVYKRQQLQLVELRRAFEVGLVGEEAHLAAGRPFLEHEWPLSLIHI